MVENINPALLPLAVPIAGLRGDSQNARRHTERDIAHKKTILTEFGQQRPLVARPDGVVVAGNGFLRAASELGWARVAVVVFDDPDKVRAYALADNRTGELSVWEEDELARTLDALALNYAGWRPELVGYTEAEAMKLIASAQSAVETFDNTPQAQPGLDGTDDAAPPFEAPGAEPSHVRMVQLFFDDKTQPRFMALVKALAPTYGTTTVTDTVLLALEELAADKGLGHAAVQGPAS